MLVWFRLKQAADKLNWYFETELPELDTESDVTRLSWVTHLRQHGVVSCTHTLAIIDARGRCPIRFPIGLYVSQSMDRRFSSTNACLFSHCNPCWSDWIRLLAHIRGCGRRTISFLSRSGSMTTGSPTFSLTGVLHHYQVTQYLSRGASHGQ